MRRRPDSSITRSCKLLKDLAGDISFALDYIGKEEKLTYVSYYDTLTGLRQSPVVLRSPGAIDARRRAPSSASSRS